MEVRADLRIEHLANKISGDKKKEIDTKVAEFAKTYAALANNKKRAAMKKFRKSIKSYKH